MNLLAVKSYEKFKNQNNEKEYIKSYEILESINNHFFAEKDYNKILLKSIKANNDKNITKEDEIDYTTTYLLLSNRRNAKYYVVRLSENLKRTISYYLPAPSTHSSILIRAPSYFIS